MPTGFLTHSLSSPPSHPHHPTAPSLTPSHHPPYPSAQGVRPTGAEAAALVDRALKAKEAELDAGWRTPWVALADAGPASDFIVTTTDENMNANRSTRNQSTAASAPSSASASSWLSGDGANSASLRLLPSHRLPIGAASSSSTMSEPLLLRARTLLLDPHGSSSSSSPSSSMTAATDPNVASSASAASALAPLSSVSASSAAAAASSASSHALAAAVQSDDALLRRLIARRDAGTRAGQIWSIVAPTIANNFVFFHHKNQAKSGCEYLAKISAFLFRKKKIRVQSVSLPTASSILSLTLLHSHLIHLCGAHSGRRGRTRRTRGATMGACIGGARGQRR